MEEANYYSTPGMIEEFKKTSVFRDFIYEVDVRMKYLESLLLDIDLKHSGREYDLFRGGLKNLNDMKEIFNDIEANIIELQGDTENDS